MVDIATRGLSRDDVFNLVKQRYEDLKGKRGTWESHWQEIADLMHPFDDNFVSHESPGSDKMTFVFDSTAIHANQLLAAGLFSMLTNPTQRWFDIGPVEYRYLRSRNIKLWFDEVSSIMYWEINRPAAKFNTSMHELYLEYGVFGNGILFLNENMSRNGLVFTSFPLSECYLCEGDSGLMDAMFRKYPRTVRQLVQKFGLARMDDNVQKKYNDQKLDDIVECIHGISPTSDYIANAPFPYVSAYVDVEHKHVISTSGYYELPFMAPRFYRNPWEQYGRGPGTTALPDVKMLQEAMRTTIRAAQKRTDPPLQAPDDGFLAPVRTTPGGINFYRAGTQDRIEPIALGSDPGVGYETVGDLRARIREIFFIDQLQLQEGPQMTATEVLQRTEERLRLMGPLMGRLQSELLGPMIERTYAILLRQEKFPPMPEELRGVPFRITYTSPVARAQEQTEANGIMRALQILTPFMEMDPSLADNFDGDELAKGIFDMYSVDEKYLRSDEEKVALRRQRAEAQRQDQTASNLQSSGQGIESITRAGLNLQELTAGRLQ